MGKKQVILNSKTAVITLLIIVLLGGQTVFAESSSTDQVGWRVISTGTVHNLAIKQDGSVWTWGGDTLGGYYGDVDTDNTMIPVRVKELSDIVQVSAGASHSVALSKEGKVWTWGSNSNGQIGNGTRTTREEYTGTIIEDHDQPVPVQVQGLSEVDVIAADWTATYVIKKDGTVWVWGFQLYTQRYTEKSSSTTPVQIEQLYDVKALALGYGHMIVLKKDGTVWTIGSQYEWVQVDGLDAITQIAAGAGVSYALKQDGTVWAWGYNEYNQLGDGSFINGSTPQQMKGIEEVVEIAASPANPYLLKKDGTVWVVGDNMGGQLGIGSFEERNVLTQIESLHKIKNIASSGFGYRAMAIRQDNTLWSWGNGYIGDGTKWWRTSPVWIKSYDTEAFMEYPITVEIDGVVVDFDQQPIVVNGRTMVPLRKIFEMLDAHMEWNPDTRTITARKGDVTVELTIGSDLALVNGKQVKLDAPAMTMNGRTLIPARFIGEALGAKVGWNPDIQTVLIEKLL